MIRNPVVFIRETVFGCKTQHEFATLLGTTQASVSRWEGAGFVPGRHQHVVRQKAGELNLKWDDRWFFAVPDASAPASASGGAPA